jgi:hypothetical protein
VAKIQMEVIPEPEPGTAAVIALQAPQYLMKEPFAVIRGKFDTDYICGCCRVTIASCVERGMLVNIVLKCLNCGSYNIVRGT